MDNLTNENQPYFDMLDSIQETGSLNMFGAPAKLRELFPELHRREAMSITTEWMKTKTVASDE